MGRTWAPATELVQGDKSGGRGCVKNKPLVLDNGGPVVAGASLEDGDWRAFMDVSEDGVEWEAGDVIPVADEDVGIIQPTLWQSGERSVHAMFRSDEGHVYRADSQDGGRTWGRGAYRTSLPNNNSGLDVAKLRDGTLLLAYNPKSNDARYPLRISLSEVRDKRPSPFPLSFPPPLSTPLHPIPPLPLLSPFHFHSRPPPPPLSPLPFHPPSPFPPLPSPPSLPLPPLPSPSSSLR